MKKRDAEITTGRLVDILQNVKSEKDAAKFIQKHTVGTYSSFQEYFNDYIVRNQLDLSQIKERSGISRNYIYNILNGDRKPGRDKILALCIAAGMTFSEINKGLRIAGEGTLYPKNERDARIVIAVNNRINNIVELNLLLEEAGLDLIK